MNTKVKKIMLFAILLIIALSIIIAILESPKTYAATTEDGSFDYTVVESEYVIIDKYLGNQSIVTIPSTIDGYPVTNIWKRAFRGCQSISKINIPESVSNIGEEVFDGCGSLLEINVDANNTNYSNYKNDGVLYNKDISKIIQYPAGRQDTSFTIPNSVTIIGKFTFYASNFLQTITIPNSVIKIESYAFFQCNQLSTVIIANGVTEIGTGAFLDCTNLKEINIPNTVEIIGDRVFEECHNLKSITIPSRVTSLEISAFHNCHSLSNISVDSSNENYANYNNDGILYDKDISKIICYPPAKVETLFTIPNSVTAIDGYAFWRCINLKEIDIPEAVTCIGESAFHYCDNLTQINIPNSVTEIGEYAFDGCSKLTSIKLSENLSNIASYLFSDCSSLTKITIPDSVVDIGNLSFYNCSSLTGIIVPGRVTRIGVRAFEECSSLNKIIIPNNVTDISSYAFDDDNNLTIVTKSNSIAHQYALDNNINIELDDTSPILQQAVYSAIEPTKGNVNVTITANEAIQRIVSDNRTWSYTTNTNNKSIISTFTDNTTNEQLKIKDLVGNEATITIDIRNIDRTAPIVTVTTDKSTYKAGETAVVTDTFNKVIQDETPKISMSGISTVEKTKMVKSSNKIYTYKYTIPNKSGTQTIIISGAIDIAGNVMEANNIKTFNVTPTMNSIDITTAPSKTTYVEGQNFDTTGMKVTANYNDGTSKEITNYTITDGNNLTTDKTSVTISYTEDDITKTTTQSITVNQKTLSSIEIKTPPTRTTYIEGQNFDATGMKVTAKYSDNSSEDITNYTIKDGNNLTTDKNCVIISYTDNGITKTISQTITVSQKVLSSIRVTNAPSKTTYIEGQNFDITGMKVIAIYNNSINKEVTDYTVTGGDNLTTEKTSVTISYTESGVTKTTTQPITVTKKLEISFDGYNEVNKDGTKYIDNIALSTTMEDMTNNVGTNGTIKVYKDNKEITDKKMKISTGMKVMISLNNESYEFTIVVKGDTNGDGESDLKDLLQINKHRLNKTLLTAEYLLAGDVNRDNEVNLKDLLQINKFRLGKINTL